MQIALFDFWIANEDRNANNANLMYDVVRSRLVSIDYGCILNTATFDYPLSLLTTTDTILWSDLFRHLAKGQEEVTIQAITDRLKVVFCESLQQASLQVNQVIEEMPTEWNVPKSVVKEKLLQLFDERWAVDVWGNFMECLNDNKQ